jgi:hypothetical protein
VAMGDRSDSPFTIQFAVVEGPEIRQEIQVKANHRLQVRGLSYASLPRGGNPAMSAVSAVRSGQR